MKEVGIHTAGMAALTICQNLLVRLMELGVLDSDDVRDILEASASMHDDAVDEPIPGANAEGAADAESAAPDPNAQTAWLIRAVIDSMSEVLGPSGVRPH